MQEQVEPVQIEVLTDSFQSKKVGGHHEPDKVSKGSRKSRCSNFNQQSNVFNVSVDQNQAKVVDNFVGGTAAKQNEAFSQSNAAEVNAKAHSNAKNLFKPARESNIKAGR